jgi:hypothetical protein
VETYWFEQVREEGIDQAEEDRRCFVGGEWFQCFCSGPTKRSMVMIIHREKGQTWFDRPVLGWIGDVQ